MKWLRRTDHPMQMQPMTSSMELELCRYLFYAHISIKWLSHCTASSYTFSELMKVMILTL